MKTLQRPDYNASISAMFHYSTISELIASWQSALEKYGDVKVIIDEDGQYWFSPMADQFSLTQIEADDHFHARPDENIPVVGESFLLLYA